MRYFALVALCTLALGRPALGSDGEAGQMVVLKAEQIAQIFCMSRTGNDEAVIAGILTDGLRSAIATADQKNDDYAKKYPDEKPPLGDGIPWQSSPDHAEGCEVGLVTLSKSDARVEIRYAFAEDPAANYTDNLILKKVPIEGMDVGHWRIDDVIYPDGTDLKGSLAAAFEGLQ
jgi:hypothetical protein